MIHPEEVIRSWLLSLTGSTLLTLVGDRIYANNDWPGEPDPYTPKGSGPGLLFLIQPSGISYDGGWYNANVQIRVAATSGVKAREVDRAVFDALNRSTGAGIAFITPITLGQSIPAIDEEWEEYQSLWLFRLRME